MNRGNVTVNNVLDNIRYHLENEGFVVSQPFIFYPVSFDIIAKRDELLLIMKYVPNIFRITGEALEDFRLFSEYLHGSVMIFGNENRRGLLENGVMYSRDGIPVVTPETFIDWIKYDEGPCVYSMAGGVFARIDGNALREIRITRNLSIGELADKVGVSRKSIQYYESGHDAELDTALDLEEILEADIIRPINFVDKGMVDSKKRSARHSNLNEFQKSICDHFFSLGYDFRIFSKTMPFETITISEQLPFLTAIVDKKDNVKKRELTIKEIVDVSGAKSFMVTEESMKNDTDIPTFTLEEILSMQSPEEFLEMIM